MSAERDAVDGFPSESSPRAYRAATDAVTSKAAISNSRAAEAQRHPRCPCFEIDVGGDLFGYLQVAGNCDEGSTGGGRRSDTASLIFRVRQAEQIAGRAYALAPDEITLLNPDTDACPVFFSRRDAEITIGIYQRVPVLSRDGDPQGNPRRVSFMTMFHMANTRTPFLGGGARGRGVAP